MGEFVSGDFITALLAQAFLLKQPGATIIYDLRASYAVRDVVAAHGGKALMNRVGHAYIKRRMRETNAVFGGEVTGHYYFRDNYFADNGMIPALLILELMSTHGKTLHELLAPLREKYFISGEINTKLAHMDHVAAKLDAIATQYADGKQQRLDGLSVEYPDWHFNVRPSNTEPLLRLNLEASTPQKMAAKQDEVVALIRS
jgi:phosphomannomutase